ncbi:glycosyltransferase [Nodularia spumigena]|uniref:4-alpha-N-acetylgalactosaminyltransferase n=2 Tax=Nodularia spumigena TaxID=70799 RepID=A0A2S0PYV7_NODSP|nr:glycosyltransferase [Nodularia spumigena]AVZ29596.1 4-alpha-N-acetylgalactosaminyltransferase [Nodularia spumigena UHCC 0039]
MHICHLILSNIGGAPKIANSLICSQKKAGNQVSTVVFTDLDSGWIVDFKDAEKVIIMKVAGSGFYIGGAIHQIWIAMQLSKVIAEIKPDIIVCHTAFISKLFYFSQMIPGSVKNPYIIYIHTDFISELQAESKINSLIGIWQNLSIRVDNWVSLLSLKQANGLVFVCKSLYERFLNMGLNPRNIEICYNPAIPDINNQPLNSTAESWLRNHELITFVSAARFHHQKDHVTLLKAFAQANHRHSNIRLILLGDGNLETEMQELASSLKISDIVLFAGTVTNPRAYFSLSRAVLLASHYEGFGMVLVEAVASGVTFIASDCPVGPREISEVLECGTLVPPNDVDALAKSIIHHVETPQERLNRSEQIERLFSESSCAKNLEMLIERIFAQQV